MGAACGSTRRRAGRCALRPGASTMPSTGRRRPAGQRSSERRFRSRKSWPTRSTPTPGGGSSERCSACRSCSRTTLSVWSSSSRREQLSRTITSHRPDVRRPGRDRIDECAPRRRRTPAHGALPLRLAAGRGHDLELRGGATPGRTPRVHLLPVRRPSWLHRLRRNRRARGTVRRIAGVPPRARRADPRLPGHARALAGDGVMVFFNDPLPVEDHQLQAIPVLSTGRVHRYPWAVPGGSRSQPVRESRCPLQQCIAPRARFRVRRSPVRPPSRPSTAAGR